MASLPELEDALKNADAAGDAASARILADEIVKMRSAPQDPAFSSTIPGKKGLSTDGEMWAANHPYAAGAATFLQGVPFIGEYFDEVAGAAAPYMGPNSEETATSAIRGGQEAFAQQNPKTALGLKIGGGITGSAVGLAAAPAALTSYAPASMAGRVGYGAGVGGLLGGAEGTVSGYGSGVDPETRAENAKSRGLLGAGLGSTIGGLMPFAQEGIKRGANWILDQANIAKQAKQAGLSKPSYEILTRAMDADQSLSGVGSQRIAAAGPDAMLADAGPSARGLLDTTIQKSGAAGATATRAVEQRAGRAKQVVDYAMDTTLGMPRGITSTETAIRKGTAAARSSAYDAAYKENIDYLAPEGKKIIDLMKRVPQSAIAKANELMKLGGHEARNFKTTVTQTGVIHTGHPDVMQLDYLTRALNDLAEVGEGAGKLGGQTAVGRSYQSLSHDLRSAAKTAVPAYKTALDTAAEPIAARNALQFGSKMLSPSVTRDDVQIGLRGMSQAEMQNAAAGVRSSIDEKLAQVSRAVSDGNMDAREAIAAVKTLSSRANHEKITALIGNQAADRLFKAIDRAATALDLRAGVAQNSKTFARLEMDKTVREMTDSGVWNAVKSGQPVNAGRRVIQNLLGGTPQAKQAAEDKIYQELTGALTGPRGAQARGLLGTLQNIGQKSPQNAARAKELSGLLGSPVVPYQIGTQSLRERATNRGQR
jgi:hypothetical protein